MIQRAADHIKRVLLPVSRVLGDTGSIALVLVMVITVVAVISRFFGAPIKGTVELSVLAFALAVFLPMAWCTLKDGHIDMDVVTAKLSKRTQNYIAVVILLIVTGVIGMLSWELLQQGIRLQSRRLETTLLSIPMFPFLYMAALSCFLMTIAFFIKFLNSLADLLGRK